MSEQVNQVEKQTDNLVETKGLRMYFPMRGNKKVTIKAVDGVIVDKHLNTIRF